MRLAAPPIAIALLLVAAVPSAAQQPDVTAPELSASLTHPGFALGPEPTAVAAKVRGTTVRYVLSEAASVRFAIRRHRPGRPAARRWKRVGALRRSGVAGENAMPFSGRIGSRPLRVGRYRMTVRAVDAAGNRSLPVRLTFFIAHW